MEAKEKSGLSIAQASRKYDISVDTLRYYERIGLLPPVPRDKNGIRVYDEESCNWIELMRCMRSAGIQIEALIEYVKLYREGGETAEARRQILLEQRELLEEKVKEMQAALERLDYKISNYDRILKDPEKTFRQQKSAAGRSAKKKAK